MQPHCQEWRVPNTWRVCEDVAIDSLLRLSQKSQGNELTKKKRITMLEAPVQGQGAPWFWASHEATETGQHSGAGATHLMTSHKARDKEPGVPQSPPVTQGSLSRLQLLKVLPPPIHHPGGPARGFVIPQPSAGLCPSLHVHRWSYWLDTTGVSVGSSCFHVLT